jgi:hypothetical protein
MLSVGCEMHVLALERALQIHLHECAVLLHAAAKLSALQVLTLLQDLSPHQLHLVSTVPYIAA